MGRKLGKIHVGIGRHLLHRGPAAAELCRAGTKGALGVDALLARDVDQGKEQIAKLHLALGRARGLGLKLGTFLGDLVPHVLDRLPLKAHGRCLARHLLGLHQRRQMRGHTIEQTLGRGLARRHDLVLGGFLGKLDLVPNLEHLVGAVGIRIAKHVRVATDELGVDIARHVGQCKLAGVRRNLCMQHHLHEHVAELLAQMRHVVCLDAIERLVGLLDHVLADALMRLLAIPRAAIGLTQTPDGLHQMLQLSRRVDQRGQIARALGILLSHVLRHGYSSSMTTWRNAPPS